MKHSLVKKEQGFSLIEVIFAIVLFSFLLLGIMQLKIKWDQINKANVFADKINLVISQLQKFQHDKVVIDLQDPSTTAVWPQTLKHLMLYDKYWKMCYDVDAYNHRCDRPSDLPWTTNKITYKIIDTQNPTKVNLTLPAVPKIYQTALLKKIPVAHISNYDGNISIDVDAPLSSRMGKGLIRQDGSAPLTDDWDVDDNAILNAKMVTVRNTNGTQNILGYGTVKEFLVQSGTWISYAAWSCPEGLTKTKHISIHSKIPALNEKYIALAGEQAYISNEQYYSPLNSYSFEVSMDYNAKLQHNHQWVKRSSGYINVRLNCSY